MNVNLKTQVVVLGAGPAGYSAAFRCADLGLETIIVEKYDTLGGVCLNVGCIPSKTLLHIAKVIEETKVLTEHGIILNQLKIDINKINVWKKQIVNQLTNSLDSMAKYRKIKIVNGLGKFSGPFTIEVNNGDNKTIIEFNNAIIAAGSRPAQLPFISYNDNRIWNSTDALKLQEIPQHMLIIGGGIIGLEISTIYHALGSTIDIVETSDQIIPSADKDITQIFVKSISKKINLMLKNQVTSVKLEKDGVYVDIKDDKSMIKSCRYDIVLVAVGRIPNGKSISAENAGVKVDDIGFISVDKQLRTNIPHIFAIGDIIGHPMLAHKGIYEGHCAAEVIAGMNHCFDPKVIPSIAYTIPEIAWIGMTEEEAKNNKINYEVAKFPWLASGRAIISHSTNGMTKLIFDKTTRRIIGGSIIGSNAGELLGEIGLSIEMCCEATDIALTIHAHPTLYETIGLASEIIEGNITDLPNIKKK